MIVLVRVFSLRDRHAGVRGFVRDTRLTGAAHMGGYAKTPAIFQIFGELSAKAGRKGLDPGAVQIVGHRTSRMPSGL